MPGPWSKKYDGPEEPQAWLSSVVLKKRAIHTEWLSKVGRGNALIDAPVDLSEVFRPGTFINALRQQTSRKLGCSMDMLKVRSVERG